MTALIIILAVLALIAITPLGVTVLYDENGFFAWVKTGIISIRVYPLRKSKKPAKKKKESKKEKPAEQTAKSGGGLQQIDEFLPILKRAIEMLKRGLVINELTVYYSAASDDAAQAALAYGRGWAALGVIDGLLSECKKVKKRDFQVFVRFDDPAGSKIYAKATATIRTLRLSIMTAVLVISLIKRKNTNKKKNKPKQRKENSNGTSD